jgi:hypothetical protein
VGTRPSYVCRGVVETEVQNMERRRLTGLLAACLAGLVLAGPAQAAGKPILIGFEKDCPELTCEETDRSPVDVSTVITPISFEAGIFRYTAVETLSSRRGSVTLKLSGFLDTNAEPDFTLLSGTVVSGSWKGRRLDGAPVFAAAYRVSGTTFAGVVMIVPASKA